MKIYVAGHRGMVGSAIVRELNRVVPSARVVVRTHAELAQTVMRVVGFDGELAFDCSQPDGTPRKLLDVSRANGLSWKAKVGLEEGIGLAYSNFLLQQVSPI